MKGRPIHFSAWNNLNCPCVVIDWSLIQGCTVTPCAGSSSGHRIRRAPCHQNLTDSLRVWAEEPNLPNWLTAHKNLESQSRDKSKVRVWLTDQHIFDALHRLSDNMQRSALMLAIPSLKLFAYCESWSILAGNSERPKVHTFFMWFIFPAAAVSQQNKLLSFKMEPFSMSWVPWNQNRLQVCCLKEANNQL